MALCMDGDGALPSLFLSEGSDSSSDEEEICDDLSLTCPNCQFKCTDLEVLKGHMIRLHFSGEDLTCPICSKDYVFIKDLENHIDRRHTEKIIQEVPPPRSERFKCSICKAKHRNRSMLKKHHLNEHKKYKFCRICLEHFPTSSKVATHMRRAHHGENSEICDLCGKAFKQKSHLTRHLKQHSVSTTFKCRICKKDFHRKDYFDTHMKTHSTSKKHACKVCFAKFKQKSHLNTHMKSHSKVKDFKCRPCKMEFTLKHHLDTHLEKYH